MKLLLHTCCAPCSVYCIDSLRQEEIEPTVYWFNPNIHPYKEYEARRNCLKEYTKSIGVEAIFEENYGIEEFCKNVSNDIQNRCKNYCYRVRLEQTAKYAKENGYDAFSTTLLVSIYQNHNAIIEIANEMAEKYGVKFLYRDFRVGFREGQAKARELGLYMQKYCGCIFSENPLMKSSNKPQIPEEFRLKNVPSLEIRKIKENKNDYMKLLLEADPSEKIINEYLDRGDLFCFKYNDDVVCVAVVVRIDKETCELKNIATKEEYRGKGYASKMIKYLCGTYKQKYNKMIVGTTENNITFYVKQGFDKYEKTIKNFFVDNYEEEIWDEDLQCIDIYYYSKKLNKK